MTYQDKRDIFEATIVAGPDNSITPDTLRGVIIGLADQLNNDISVTSNGIENLSTSFAALNSAFDDVRIQVPYNHTATTDPTSSDDGNNTSGNGVFSFTSKWLNSSSGNLFLCEDASTGAAEWSQIDFNSANLGALALLNTVGADQIAPSSVTVGKLANDAVAADLGSTDNAKGASLIGIEDSGENFVGDDVEAALAELATSNNTGPDFTSSGQTYTNGGSVSVAHGLGTKPKTVTLTYVCTTADATFAAGDEIHVNDYYVRHGSATQQDYGITVYCDATTINANIGDEGLRAINTSGVITNLSSADWELVFKAWS